MSMRKIVQDPFHRSFKIIYAKFWGDDNPVSKYKRQSTETKDIISGNWIRCQLAINSRLSVSPLTANVVRFPPM